MMTFTWFISQVGVFWSTLQLVLGLTKLMKSNVYRAHTVNGFQFWVKHDFVGTVPFFFIQPWTVQLHSFQTSLLLLLSVPAFWSPFVLRLLVWVGLPYSAFYVRATGEGPINPCSHNLNHVRLLCGNYSCANLIAWGVLSTFK